MQTTSTAFDALAKGSVRPLSYAFRASFDKAFDDGISLFTLNTSVLDGSDVLAPAEDNPIQLWDKYNYLPYTDRIQMLEWSREIEFPNSVSSAMADFVLENHDDYFTPNSGSPIDEFILPRRPVRILSGFNNENLPQFVGLTEKTPVISDRDKTATFHAIDFLAKIYTMPITQTIAMRDVTTDVVLAALFEQLGLTPDQYSLKKGRNKIPFLFYDKTKTLAGDTLRQLMEAEAGNLWLSETGIIMFEPRIVAAESVVYSFDESNTNDVTTTADDNIINTVKITADLREVQSFQSIHLKSVSSENFVVIAGQDRVYEGDLTDPCISAILPTRGIGTGVSWFTAELPDGTEVISGITATLIELTTNAVNITFHNSNGFDVNIAQMDIWGEPAKIYDHIDYTEVNQDSIDKFEEQVLTIDNPFIQSIDQCDSIAQLVLDSYAEYAGQIEIDVKGTPALQMNDIVSVNVRSYVGDYKIIKMDNKLQSGRYTQVLTARKYEPRQWFILDQSLLNGTDVLTP